MSQSNPIVIIGAGPAGSTAGISLARAGSRVILIEQHRFPRPKVCGECISSTGVEVLRSLNLLDVVISSGATTFTRSIVHSSRGTSKAIELPAVMLGLSRDRLDQLLLHESRQSGASVCQPVRCERVESGSITIRDLQSNRSSTIEFSTLLLADGRGAFESERPRPTGTFGIKAHFENVDASPDAIELFAAPGCYGGIAAVESGRWNVSFSVSGNTLSRHGGNIETLFKSIQSKHPTLHRRMRRAIRVSEWLAAPLPRFKVAERWQPNVIPIGNAAAAIEPIGGEGMGLAMRSGQLAAEAIIDARMHHVAVDVESLRSQFKSLWSRRAVACRAAGFAASHPWLVETILPMVEAHTWPARDFITAMGKSPPTS